MFEEEVREMLQSKVRQAPALDEPPAKVMRRARGRRAMNGAGVTLALAAIAVGSLFGVRSLGTSEIEPATKVVKWVELEAFKGHPAPSRPCGAGDFTFTVGREDAPNVSPRGRFMNFTPASWRTTCKLDLGSDAQTLRFIDDAGRDMEISVRPRELTSEIWGSANTFVFHEWTNYCGPATRSVRYEISFPSGDKVAATAAAVLPRCTDRTKPSTIGTAPENGPALLQQRLDGTAALPDEFHISLRAPETVRHSEILRYQVVFTNVTDRPVRLEPCPDFVHYLKSETQGNPPPTYANGGAYHLNCAGLRGPIGPGKSVAFEMRIQTGADSLNYLPVGRWEIEWLFATGADPVSAPVFII